MLGFLVTSQRLRLSRVWEILPRTRPEIARVHAQRPVGPSRLHQSPHVQGVTSKIGFLFLREIKKEVVIAHSSRYTFVKFHILQTLLFLF